MDLARALSLIRPIPDYPKPGILFQDITPLLADPRAFATVVDAVAALDKQADFAVGIEARGFILASAVALRNEIGFVPIRKKGKLPAHTYSRAYGLEYGEDVVEIHRDAFTAAAEVVLIDDVLATGGTLEAAIGLVRDAGAHISSIVTLLEISQLGGRDRIGKIAPGVPIHALVTL